MEAQLSNMATHMKLGWLLPVLFFCTEIVHSFQQFSFSLRDVGCQDLDLYMLHGQENITGDEIPSIYKYSPICSQMSAR